MSMRSTQQAAVAAAAVGSLAMEAMLPLPAALLLLLLPLRQLATLAAGPTWTTPAASHSSKGMQLSQ